MNSIEKLITRHRFEHYNLRCGCSCGWGTTPLDYDKQWPAWAGHIADELEQAARESAAPDALKLGSAGGSTPKADAKDGAATSSCRQQSVADPLIEDLLEILTLWPPLHDDLCKQTCDLCRWTKETREKLSVSSAAPAAPRCTCLERADGIGPMNGVHDAQCPLVAGRPRQAAEEETK